MKTILTNLTVLALLAGISGCLFPFRDWREGRREGRYQQGNRDQRYEQGDRDQRYDRESRDQSGHDCWSRDGRVYCRND